MKPLITTAELQRGLADSRTVLIDARAGADAALRYAQGHLRGARFVDLDRDLARRADVVASGGRHPLPAPADFARVLARLGIGSDSQVVAYDDKSGANAAARFWWMARSAGLSQVQVLDGGLQAAIEHGLELVVDVDAHAEAEPIPFSAWRLPLADADVVRDETERHSAPVIDVREPRRYRGEVEPFDLVTGHIPGAVNLPFIENLDEFGRFLEPAVLRAAYEKVLAGRPPESAIVHCGSGVTACHTLLGFDLAGLAMPRLYVGSWSEWSGRGLPIATGE